MANLIDEENSSILQKLNTGGKKIQTAVAEDEGMSKLSHS